MLEKCLKHFDFFLGSINSANFGGIIMTGPAKGKKTQLYGPAQTVIFIQNRSKSLIFQRSTRERLF
jgi:hypothetical protein